MPYVSCSKCHHEWETIDLTERCDWCKSPIGKVLEETTPLERMVDEYVKFLEKLGGKNVR